MVNILTSIALDKKITSMKLNRFWSKKEYKFSSSTKRKKSNFNPKINALIQTFFWFPGLKVLSIILNHDYYEYIKNISILIYYHKAKCLCIKWF